MAEAAGHVFIKTPPPKSTEFHHFLHPAVDSHMHVHGFPWTRYSRQKAKDDMMTEAYHRLLWGGRTSRHGQGVFWRRQGAAAMMDVHALHHKHKQLGAAAQI